MSTRDELTRQAEKSLRQGRVDEAITHYQALAYLAPVDWGLVKQLADLLERAGQREGAAQQFARWADHLAAEGFHSKAAALYKKVLKLDASHEYALWHLGEVSIELNLRADARGAFQRVADIRQRRGDAAGAAAARERVAVLDATPAPISAVPQMPPAYAAAAPTQAPGTPTPPREPETPEARLSRLRRAAEQADAHHASDADVRWQAVLDEDPEDVAVRLRLVQAAIDRADLERASRLALSLDAAEDAALAVLVDLAWRRGQPDAVVRLVAGRVHAGTAPEHVLAPVTMLSERHPEAARAALSAAVAAWTAVGQPGHAVAALEQVEGRGLLTTSLHLQWVAICVDAGVPDLSRAQRALARAYLDERRLAEARAVAEDVFVREAGAEPSRGLLLDILDREGVADPHRVLVDLLIPASDILADGEEPAADPRRQDDVVIGHTSAHHEAPDDSPSMTIAVGAYAERFLASLEARASAPVEGLGSGIPAAPAASQVEPLVEATPVPVPDPDLTSAAGPEPAAGPPFAPAPAAPADAPAAPAPRPAFNWADLLGRDVDAPAVTAQPAATRLEETPAFPPTAEAVSEPASAPVPLVVEREGGTGAPSRPSPPCHAPVQSSPDVDPVASDHASSSADASNGLGDLRAQPMFADDAPLQPSFSMPRGWLSEAVPAATDDSARRRAPEDDFFFADDATPPRWAPPAVRTSGQVTKASMAPVAGIEADNPPPANDTAAPTHVVEIEAVAGSVDHGDAALLIEEEVDLTQLLEELKQWDPVLPEPRPRPRVEGADDSLAGLPLDYPMLAPESDPTPDPPVSTSPARGASAEAADSMAVEVTTPPEDAPVAEALAAHRAVPGAGSDGLEAVFAGMQRHSDGHAVAEQQLAAGRVFLAAGLASEAARAFERASGEPRARFAGSLALAELHKSRGQLVEAVSWYEQAAAASVPDAAVKRPVLYDLAESLEALGETDRALGVLLDLLSQVEDYRDARARLDRLLRVDAGG